MSENKSYNHIDIKRYLQQQMSPQEMHAFEKELMDDPFLSDAVDGFLAADEQMADKHLKEIESNLPAGKSETKIIPFAVKKTGQWRVAAIAFVIVFAGLLTYSLLHRPPANENANTSVTANKSTQQLSQNDSFKAEEKQLVNADIKLPAEQLNRVNIPPMVIHSKEVPLARLNKANISNDMSVSEAYSAKPSVSADLAAPAQPDYDADDTKKEMTEVSKQALPQNEFKERIIAKTAEPAPYSSVKVTDKNMAASADENGKLDFKLNDSIKAEVNSSGYANANVQLQSTSPLNGITAQQNRHEQSEIAVISYSNKRKRSVTASAVKDIAVPVPVAGWSSYMDHIKKQADSTLLADRRSFNNIAVMVEFIIDKKGQPVKLKTSSVADKYYVKKAIHIVGNGPAWKTSDADKKAKVTVSF